MADISESGGWVKLHRCLLDSEVIHDGTALAVFVYCVLRANSRPRVWRGKEIARGCLVTSAGTACEALSLSPNTWRAALGRLVAMGMIETSTETMKFTEIRVVNYEKWQSGAEASSAKTEQLTDKLNASCAKTEQLTDELTDKLTEQLIEHKQEGKKVRSTEEREEASATPSPPPPNPPAKTPRPKPPAFDPLTVTIPPAINTPLTQQAWAAWIEHRREIKRPLTPKSAIQQMRLLASLGADVAVETIRASIIGGWQGLFPEKVQARMQHTNTKPVPEIPRD